MNKTGTKKSQAHKNTHTYELRYRDDKKDLLKNAALDRLCTHCKEILEWKLKFGKFKPIKEAKKCQTCLKSTVVKPYRAICNKCSDDANKCTKCCVLLTDLPAKHATLSMLNARKIACEAIMKKM
jgi:hypothetical protein